MIVFASKNNPTAKYKILDAREILNLNNKFDAIICGFCLPYLTDVDAEKFILDCSRLLNKNGLFYLSFVEGDKYKSGIMRNSLGDESFFNFFTLEEIIKYLNKYGFKLLLKQIVPFAKSDGSTENHVLLIASLV